MNNINNNIYSTLIKQNYKGIKNYGNTCYLSSLLQILIRLPIFHLNTNLIIENYNEYILRTNNYNNFIQKNINVFTEIINIIQHYIKTSQLVDPSPINIIHLLSIINNTFQNFNEQQDTQEILTLILDFCNHHIIEFNCKKIFEENFITKIKKIIHCKKCEHKIINEDMILNLSLCYEDRDLINQGHKIEKLDDYKCDNCKNIGNIYKEEFIIKTPNILFIYYPDNHIFQNNSIGYLNHNIKIVEHAVNEHTNSNSTKLIDYKLQMAVIRLNLSNNQLQCGHYYINIYDKDSSKWIRCDDEIIIETNFDMNEYINIRMYVYEKII